MLRCADDHPGGSETVTRTEIGLTAALVVVSGALAYTWFARRGPEAPGAPDFDSATTAVRPPPPPPRPAVTGRVRSATGVALAGVRVVLAGRESGQPTWIATDTSLEGEFDLPLARGRFDEGAPLELRVRAAGFVSRRLPVSPGATDVVLERGAREPVPGRVRGVVRDAEGFAVKGLVVVSGFDEFLTPLRRAAVADPKGAFSLDGVPPGTWTLGLTDDGPRADVVVPEDGEVRVELRRAGVPRAPRRLSDAEYADAEYAISLRLSEAGRRAARPDATREVLAAAERDIDAAEEDLARLRCERLAFAPHRALDVQGLPGDRRVWVSVPADDGDWVVEASAGTARVPPVVVGPVTVTIRRLDAAPVELHVTVEPGASPQQVTVPSALLLPVR